MIDKKYLGMIMLSKDINQKTLAEKLGISRVALHNKIRNKAKFTQKDIKKFIEILDLSFEDVLKIWFWEEFDA